MDQSACAPTVVQPNARKSNSCMNLEALQLIARMYNDHNRDTPIKLYKTKKSMMKALDERLASVCARGDQSCWLKQPFATSEPAETKAIARKHFKPPKPGCWQSNKNTWLTNFDIENVMRQYDAADKQFKFLGVHAIDFSNVYDGKCISPDICDLQLSKLRRSGVHCIGFVFNTDTHDRSGQHWISLFVGLRPTCANYGVFFYDSVADAPPPRLQKYMDTLHAQLAQLTQSAPASATTKPRLEINSKRRQYLGTECGIYALLFIIRMRTERFEHVCRTMGNDAVTEKYRDIFFREGK
jgi:hypothetical protein